MPEGSDLMSVRSAAEAIGVHENTMRNWTNSGLVHAVRLPTGVRRIPRSEVERIQREMFSAPPVFDQEPYEGPPVQVAETCESEVVSYPRF